MPGVCCIMRFVAQNHQANAMQASACALAMLSECGKYDVGKGEEAVALRLHCGMGRWVVLGTATLLRKTTEKVSCYTTTVVSVGV